MRALAEALADPTTRNWYMAFCFAVMILPVVGITWWYHRNIGKTEGGRRLMDRQTGAQRDLPEASEMAKDIAAGRYGDEARAMQNRVYWFFGLWVLANAIAFGLLLWADEINRPPSG